MVVPFALSLGFTDEDASIYHGKHGRTMYKKGCEAVASRFDMSLTITVKFVTEMQAKGHGHTQPIKASLPSPTMMVIPLIHQGV
jgi:hypothetical protein